MQVKCFYCFYYFSIRINCANLLHQLLMKNSYQALFFWEKLPFFPRCSKYSEGCWKGRQKKKKSKKIMIHLNREPCLLAPTIRWKNKSWFIFTGKRWVSIRTHFIDLFSHSAAPATLGNWDEYKPVTGSAKNTHASCFIRRQIISSFYRCVTFCIRGFWIKVGAARWRIDLMKSGVALDVIPGWEFEIHEPLPRP